MMEVGVNHCDIYQIKNPLVLFTPHLACSVCRFVLTFTVRYLYTISVSDKRLPPTIPF